MFILLRQAKQQAAVYSESLWLTLDSLALSCSTEFPHKWEQMRIPRHHHYAWRVLFMGLVFITVVSMNIILCGGINLAYFRLKIINENHILTILAQQFPTMPEGSPERLWFRTLRQYQIDFIIKPMFLILPMYLETKLDFSNRSRTSAMNLVEGLIAAYHLSRLHKRSYFQTLKSAWLEANGQIHEKVLTTSIEGLREHFNQLVHESVVHKDSTAVSAFQLALSKASSGVQLSAYQIVHEYIPPEDPYSDTPGTNIFHFPRPLLPLANSETDFEGLNQFKSFVNKEIDRLQAVLPYLSYYKATKKVLNALPLPLAIQTKILSYHAPLMSFSILKFKSTRQASRTIFLNEQEQEFYLERGGLCQLRDVNISP